MSDESIELLKPWETDKMVFPGEVQPKIDGVPIRIRNMGGYYFAWTRDNERVESMDHIIDWVQQYMPLEQGQSIVGECYVPGMPFKDISGLVRTKKHKMKPGAGYQRVFILVFDAQVGTAESYNGRIGLARMMIRKGVNEHGSDYPPVRCMPSILVRDIEQAEMARQTLMATQPTLEGVCYHSYAKPFQPGTRRWDTQKWKPEPTLDVMVTGFEQAVDKFGVAKPEIGGVHIFWHEYQGGELVKVVGKAGPGRLKKSERIKLWADYVAGKFEPAIAEVKYMLDATYDGLRQPTFQHWRKDKQDVDTRNR